MSAPAPDEKIYAVALFPALVGGGEVRELRVVALDLFGGTPADTIGALVREVDERGVPYAGRAREAILPIQRIVFARKDEGGRLIFSARELAEKRAAYVAQLAGGALNLIGSRAPRRKPALAPQPAGWLAEHEANAEAAA